jgi:paraquat-inducible protein B
MLKVILQKFKAHKSSFYIWVFPMIALIFSGWIFADYLFQRGPSIKIYFADASNIHPEKTRIRVRGVTVGIVKKVSLSSDGKEVIAYVDLQREAAYLAVEGSKFWVIVPKVNLSGVSGLETLFEGPYITVLPGKIDGLAKDEFNGQVGSDTNEAIENTTQFYLETPNAESLGIGDVVTFRGLNVGSITKLNLNRSAQSVMIQLNIQNKHLHLIRKNTAFWKKIGIQGKLGIFGSEIKINSLESILHGGVELFTPEPAAGLAKSKTVFSLSTVPPKGSEKWNPNLNTHLD